MKGRRAVVLLGLVLVSLLAARALHTRLIASAREYYVALSGSALAEQFSESDEGVLAHCNVEACIRELSQRPPPDGVLAVGACDLFLYEGGVAVSGLLAFLTLYTAFLLVGLTLHRLVPPRAQKAFLLRWSLLFLLVVLPVRPVLWILQMVLLLFAAARAPFSDRTRAVLVLLAGVLLLATLGRATVEATQSAWFRLSATSLGAEGGEALPGVFEFLKLGTPGERQIETEGFPCLFLALALLLKSFRRVLWLASDLATGRAGDVPLQEFLLYFLGLPALLGNAVTPSFLEFQASHGRDPGPERGLATVAWCLGVVPVLYVAVAMMAWSPAVRLLFPRCDLEGVGAGQIWLRLVAVFVLEYLAVLATDQASVGVARLFGFGLRDNYEAPLAARGLADYWRRWNIYWREFLMEVFFWPVTLALARRSGKVRTSYVVAGAFATFGASFALNAFPMILLLSAAPGASQAGGGAPASLVGSPFVASLATFYALEAFFVSLGLAGAHRQGAFHFPDDSGPWPRRLLAVAATIALVSALRVFLDPSMTPGEQWEMLGKALGLG